MIDFATDLKQRFDWAVYVSLEAYEVLPDGKSIVRSDERERAIDLFENLHDSVDAVPPPLIKAAEALRDAAPDLFEKALLHGLRVVGHNGFFPASATEFIEVLNRTIERDSALRV
jgi:hypothetical protein